MKRVKIGTFVTDGQIIAIDPCLKNKKDFFYDLDIMKLASYYKSKREITKLLLDPMEYTQYTQTFFVKNRFDYKLFSELFKDKRITYRGYAFYGHFLAPLPDDIEKAILQSDLGLVPMNDGNLIRMAIPQLTEERRKELVKIVNKKSEEAKVAIRNIRRDGNDFLKKEEKNSDVSKDVIKGMEEKVQKLTDNKIKELETVTEKKIKEIMSV